MKIGLDAKRYFYNQTGLGNYSRDLSNQLFQSFPENQFYLFNKKTENIHLPENVKMALPSGSRLLWREYGIVGDIKSLSLDVYHGLSNELPFGNWPESVLKVVSIHDVIFKHFPNYYKGLDAKIYDFKTKHAIEISDKIIATSKTTALDLIKYYNAVESKISVIYQTCNPIHKLKFPYEMIENFRAKYDLPTHFILYVSSFQKRKNHIALLNALKACKGKAGMLVLAGKSGETLNECINFIKQNELEKYVCVLEDVSFDELPLLYRSASAFVYPSKIEGFGIPLLEAAHAGLPIAVNDVPIFNELAPDESLKFVADDTKGFAKVLIDLSTQKKFNYSDYLGKFDSEFCANQVFKLYK